MDNIREAVRAAKEIAHNGSFDGCDISEIDEITDAVDRELVRPLPNGLTLATYLNSLARSLRSQPAARKAVMQLDAAMRDAGLTTDWEH
jgi:hypothetical protein